MDDEAAASPLMQAAMNLSLPPNVGNRVLRFEEVDWKALSQSPRRVLLLVRGIEEAIAAVNAGAEVGHVNLGNVHFAAGRVAVSPSLFLSKEELAKLEELATRGVEVEAKAVPSERGASLEELGARLARSSSPR